MIGANSLHGRYEKHIYILVRKPEGKTPLTPLEDKEIDGRITLKCILEKQGKKSCSGFKWLRIGPNNGLL
jgi:hypothetical protein